MIIDLSFEEKVYSDAYENPLPYSTIPSIRAAYRSKESEIHAQFMEDLKKYLMEKGVPEQYAPKVAIRAYQDGHANGYHEVFNCALNLLEIFQ